MYICTDHVNTFRLIVEPAVSDSLETRNEECDESQCDLSGSDISVSRGSNDAVCSVSDTESDSTPARGNLTDSSQDILHHGQRLCGDCGAGEDYDIDMIQYPVKTSSPVLHGGGNVQRPHRLRVSLVGERNSSTKDSHQEPGTDHPCHCSPYCEKVHECKVGRSHYVDHDMKPPIQELFNRLDCLVDMGMF